MATEGSDGAGSSLFGNLIGRQRPIWVTAAIAVVLFSLPLLVASLDGLLGTVISNGIWRTLFLPPTVILYILVVGPILAGMEKRVVQAFRPLVPVGEEAFDQIVSQASRSNPIVETAAFAGGVCLGLWMALAGREASRWSWMELWLVLSGSLMFGLLGWTIYAALAGTRLTAALHRQPLRIDIFDTKPFEPIGLQSLAIALVFVGGIALSMLFGLGQLDILAWQNWVLYVILIIVIVLVFFLNMRDTHRILASAKRQELERVEGLILQGSRTLMDRIAQGESSNSLGEEINALATYEARVQGTRTWPYDTAMLRTLFFSLFIPAIVELVKLIANWQSK